MPKDKHPVVVPSMIDLVKHNEGSETKTIKGFSINQKKIKLFEGDIEQLKIKSFVLPRYISSQLDIEADLSALVSPSMVTSTRSEESKNLTPDSKFEHGKDDEDSITFKKDVNFLRVQKKFKLASRWVVKSRLKRRVGKQKSRKLTIFKGSLSAKRKTRLKPFESKHFVCERIIEDKFIQQRIKFLNTVQPLVGPNSIPPNSTPTICQEHSKVNLSRTQKFKG